MFPSLIGNLIGQMLFNLRASVLNRIGGFGVYFPTFAIWGAIGAGGIVRILTIKGGQDLVFVFWILGIVLGLIVAYVLKKTLMTSEANCYILLHFAGIVGLLNGFFLVSGRTMSLFHFNIFWSVAWGALGAWINYKLIRGYLFEQMIRDGYYPVDWGK